jgi:hypothetical protein
LTDKDGARVRCWYTPDGEILVEDGRVSPSIVSGFAVHDEADRPLESAHRYRLFDAWGALRQVFEPHSGSIDDELWGWTHEVIGTSLVRFLSSHVTSRAGYQRRSHRSVERAGLVAIDPLLAPRTDAATVDDAEAGLAAALARLSVAFAGYPVRDVLPGCPCCKGDVRWADYDLVSLAISLGNTIGTADDLKALLPMLLTRLVDSELDTGAILDETVVLGKLAGWRDWPAVERDAIEDYLHAVWRALLSTYPSRTGSLTDSATFLRAVVPVYGDPGDFLRSWRAVNPSAADRHLADLVGAWVYSDGLPPEVARWVREPDTRGLVYLGFVRSIGNAAGPRPAAYCGADDLAWAYDILGDPTT